MIITDDDRKLIGILWEYQAIRQEPEKADLIWVLCSFDLRIAEYAAQLYLDGYAHKVLISGSGFAHKDDLLATPWEESEAVVFRRTMIESGVPDNVIIIEDKSQNTGENVRFAFDVMNDKYIAPRKVLMVQKPWMLRRVYATYMAQWPGEKFDLVMTSPDLDFDSYCKDSFDEEMIANIVVGDMQRIKEYPEKGF